MRKFLVLSLLFIISLTFLGSCKTFDGYYFTLEQAREEKNFYDNSTYLFTKNLDEVIIDFIIKDNVLHIVQIDIRESKSSTQFKVEHSSSYSIEEAILKFQQKECYNWTTTSKLSKYQISWCVVDVGFNLNNEAFSSFEFIYNDKSYCLCYDMNK